MFIGNCILLGHLSKFGQYSAQFGGIFTLTWARVRVFWLYVVTNFLERQAIHMVSQNVTPFFRFVEKQPV